MKTASDPRHQNRIKLFKLLYSYIFNPRVRPAKTIKPIIAKLKPIDKIIVSCAPEWPVNKLNKVDLAILRLAIFELKFAAANPPKVIIDEAIELAKTFGTETTPKFINGVLGTVIKHD